MAKVIGINAGVRREKTQTLNDYLREAQAAFQETVDRKSLVRLNPAGLEELFKKRLFGLIIKRGMVESRVFLCAQYVAGVIRNSLGGFEYHFWATDYFARYAESQDPEFLKKGGDICFIICAFFPGWANRRAMKERHYEEMGGGFYFNFYNQTSREIGFHMSALFSPLVKMTRDCLEEI